MPEGEAVRVSPTCAVPVMDGAPVAGVLPVSLSAMVPVKVRRAGAALEAELFCQPMMMVSSSSFTSSSTMVIAKVFASSPAATVIAACAPPRKSP